MGAHEASAARANRIFYLAVPPVVFKDAASSIKAAGMVRVTALESSGTARTLLRMHAWTHASAALIVSYRGRRMVCLCLSKSAS